MLPHSRMWSVSPYLMHGCKLVMAPTLSAWSEFRKLYSCTLIEIVMCTLQFRLLEYFRGRGGGTFTDVVEPPSHNDRTKLNLELKIKIWGHRSITILNIRVLFTLKNANSSFLTKIEKRLGLYVYLWKLGFFSQKYNGPVGPAQNVKTTLSKC